MSRPALVLDDATDRLPQASGNAGPWQVVADGDLYYRGDLLRRIGGDDADTATLIARALERGDEDALHWFEGDFTFIAWHTTQRRVIAARDFGGRYPLFYAWHERRLYLGRAERELLADGRLPRSLDLTNLTIVAAGMWSQGDFTVYTAIRELPAGSVLRWRPGSAPVVRRFWYPEPKAPHRGTLEDAASELRQLLDDAVRERLDPEGRTAVTLSGGWDSTAVYASARAIGAPVHGVSISYPEGDPGREDETIASVTRHWGDEPDFIDIADIPFYADWAAEAAQRPRPFAHAYERWNRALARRANERGARVILDGVGGDQLFQVSEIYLAELFRRGHWISLARELPARSTYDGTLRTLYRWAIRPNLPKSLSDRIARWRGLMPARHYLDRLPPIWFRRSFLEAHGVMQRERAHQPKPNTKNHVLAEAQAYLSLPFYPRVFAHLTGFARDEGVTLRSPLLDERIVRFSLARPWSDRIRGPETKRSLRLAMRGRLPDEVLAPRPRRTGTTNGYMRREMLRAGWPVAESLLDSMRLVDIGMVEPTRYRRAWDHIRQHEDDDTTARLFFTLQAELWLRSHLA